MAKPPTLGLTINYNVQNREEVTPLVQSLANDFSISGGGAVTINGAEISNATITGGALVTTSGKNATIQVASAPNKQNPQFSLSSSAVTLSAFEPATISTSHQGDGIVTYYADNRFITAEQLNANDFRIAAKYIGEGDIGFWLSETTSLYGAAKNCHVVVDENHMPVLMHFDDSTDILKNEGYVTFTTSQSFDYQSSGKFDGALYRQNSAATLTPTNSFVLGGKDFTVDFWNKESLVDFKLAFSTIIIEIYENSTGGYSLFESNTPERIISTAQKTSEWQHLAAVYQHDLGLLKFYIGGVLQGSLNTTINRQDVTEMTLVNLYIDELRILDGVAAWTSDFTPPSMPY